MTVFETVLTLKTSLLISIYVNFPSSFESLANSRYKGIFSLADIREIAFAYPSSCIFAVLPMF